LSNVALKFERLLETYRRENGGKWSGIELERATGGVTRSYVTNLRKGRIENPGMDKLAALASRRWASPPLSGSRRGYPTRTEEEPRGGPKGSPAESGACSRRSRTPRRESLIRT
jgi:transcriptional regulator with XRE-family HTH domain